jgi:hypothetical protein
MGVQPLHRNGQVGVTLVPNKTVPHASITKVLHSVGSAGLSGQPSGVVVVLMVVVVPLAVEVASAASVGVGGVVVVDTTPIALAPGRVVVEENGAATAVADVEMADGAVEMAEEDVDVTVVVELVASSVVPGAAPPRAAQIACSAASVSPIAPQCALWQLP